MTLDLSHLLEVAEGAKALFKSGTLTNAPLRDTSDRVVGFRITPEIMLEEDWIFAAPIERVRGLRELALAFPALLARLQAAEEALRPFAEMAAATDYGTPVSDGTEMFVRLIGQDRSRVERGIVTNKFARITAGHLRAAASYFEAQAPQGAVE